MKSSLGYKATACPIKSIVFSYNSKYLTKSEKGFFKTLPLYP
jgi:hypothetical protein